MPRYKLEFSYKAKIHYDVYNTEDGSFIREDCLMEKIKSIIHETKCFQLIQNNLKINMDIVCE